MKPVPSQEGTSLDRNNAVYKLTIIVLLLFTSACKILYVPDIQQGNVITNKMLEQLKIGMNQKQVKFILGTPLVKDPFHKDRWDYFYSYKNNKNNTFKKSRVTVFFENGKMVTLDVVPKRTKENAADYEITINPEVYDGGRGGGGGGGGGHGH